MAPRPQLSLPTPAPLPHTLRLPSNSPVVFKTLIRVSRPALITLALEWLQKANQNLCPPYLSTDEDDEDDDGAYSAAQSLEELREIYQELQDRKGAKREVVDRILEGDWRRGITLYQLATVDVRYLLDRPSSQRWTALTLSRVVSDSAHLEDRADAGNGDNSTVSVPRFHAQTFLRNLQQEIAPIVKAHFYLTRAPSLPVTLLRVYIHDSPYNSQRSLFESDAVRQAISDSAKTLYVAFPDGAPAIYVSLVTTPGQSAAGEGRSLRKVVLDALPKALSRPRARFTLRPSSLSARSLTALLALRGPGRGSAAPGGWSIFADGSAEDSPLDHALPESKRLDKQQEHADTQEDKPDKTNGVSRRRGRPQSTSDSTVSPATKKRRLTAKGRFGDSALESDGKGLERLDIRIEDPLPQDTRISSRATISGVANASPTPSEASVQATPSQPEKRGRGRPRRSSFPTIVDDPTTSEGDTGWRPSIQLTFHGTHVFAGIRKLVEDGVVDGLKMPGWMTGEAGVSVGVVRDGRVRRREGV
ncbi:MAG: hypothetical protein M1819_005050 [Sarea resinae]|nr:MAG: hypothetical protein M1819_005050 [Sarea resinae]